VTNISQEFLPTRWRQKSTGIDTEQNYVNVTLRIATDLARSVVGLCLQCLLTTSMSPANTHCKRSIMPFGGQTRVSSGSRMLDGGAY